MSLTSDILGLRSWYIQSHDTVPEKILQGQFEPENTTENVGSKYAQNNALNRKHPIIQFINGEAETLSFQARLFARDALFSSVKDDLELLKAWTRRDEALRRPHICSFWVGDGNIAMDSCVIQSLSGITYGKPSALGTLKDVILTINLLQYEPYSLELIEPPETRYHRAKADDYYEMLCFREYGNAMMGDIIRKRHPAKPYIKVADIVKLPSAEAIRKETTEPKSLALYSAYGRKITPQRTLRLAVFDQHQQSRYSHVMAE
jgi:hypothetical protein